MITFCLLRCCVIKQSSNYDCVLLLGTVRGTAAYNCSSQHWWSILTELLRHGICRFWYIAVGMGQHWILFRRHIWACNGSNNEEFYLVRCDKVHFDGQVRTFRGNVGLHIHGRREDGCTCEVFVRIYELHWVTTRTHLRTLSHNADAPPKHWLILTNYTTYYPGSTCKIFFHIWKLHGVRPERTIFVSKYYT